MLVTLSHCCKQCGPRSDCSSRSSLIWVHTVCLNAKSLFEKFAIRCSRRHKQTTFSDASFLGILRVKRTGYTWLIFCHFVQGRSLFVFLLAHFRVDHILEGDYINLDRVDLLQSVFIPLKIAKTIKKVWLFCHKFT